ncbi:hypothetical protein KR222_001914, partial [Zaprionus bogoriensis]
VKIIYIETVELRVLFSAKQAINIKLTNIICETFNKTWLTVNECRLRAISRNMTVLNYNATMHYSVYDIVARVEVFKKANGYKPWLFKFSIDWCKFIKKAYHPVANIMFSVIKEFTNMNHTCPYVGDQVVKGLYIKPELLRLPFPTGEYLVNVLFFFDKKVSLVTKIYFTYEED